MVDTLAVAKEMFPGERVSLDALCTRFEVDRTERETEGHGALLDALLLAEVYLRMTGGQRELTFGDDASGGVSGSRKRARKTGAHFKVIHPSEAELALHESILDYVARVGRCTPVFRKEPEPPAEGAEAAGKQ